MLDSHLYETKHKDCLSRELWPISSLRMDSQKDSKGCLFS
jgi:hypothetical protein